MQTDRNSADGKGFLIIFINFFSLTVSFALSGTQENGATAHITTFPGPSSMNPQGEL